MKTLLAAAATLMISLTAAWADPSGAYAVQGVDPKGAKYSGELVISKVGDVYELNYTYSDGSEQEGSAIGDDDFLAYGYGDDEELGVGLMNGKGGSWEGIWTNVGSTKLGLETWTKK